MTKLLNQPYI